MEFMYVGEEAETTIFGITFRRGEAEEVTDERAIRKLKSSSLFTHNSSAEVPPSEEPKRRGRPPRVENA
jgi:hypothetical protein